MRRRDYYKINNIRLNIDDVTWIQSFHQLPTVLARPSIAYGQGHYEKRYRCRNRGIYLKGKIDRLALELEQKLKERNNNVSLQ